MQSNAKRFQNRTVRSTLLTIVKKFTVALQSGDAAAAAAAYDAAQKCIDKTAAKKVIHKGKASRMKSRLSAQLNKAKTAKK